MKRRAKSKHKAAPKKKKFAFRCTTDVRAVPIERYKLETDGPKWKALCRERKHLVQYMATYANADGTNIRPSIGTLADIMGLHRATVFRRMADLRKLGVLEDGGLDPRHHFTRIRNMNLKQLKEVPVSNSNDVNPKENPFPISGDDGDPSQIENDPSQIEWDPSQIDEGPVADRPYTTALDLPPFIPPKPVPPKSKSTSKQKTFRREIEFSEDKKQSAAGVHSSSSEREPEKGTAAGITQKPSRSPQPLNPVPPPPTRADEERSMRAAYAELQDAERNISLRCAAEKKKPKMKAKAARAAKKKPPKKTGDGWTTPTFTLIPNAERRAS